MAGSGKGGYIPRSTSGGFGFGPAVFSCSDSRPQPPAPLAGFSLDPRLALAVAVDPGAAIHRVKGACHVIVAPLMARGAAEHGVSWIGRAVPARGVRAVAAGPPPELEQILVQGAHRAPTP